MNFEIRLQGCEYVEEILEERIYCLKSTLYLNYTSYVSEQFRYCGDEPRPPLNLHLLLYFMSRCK